MPRNAFAAFCTLILLLALAAPAAPAQSAERTMPMRTPDGQPDVSGTFTFRTLTPLERPQQFERGVELTSDKRTSLIVDPPSGRRPPRTPEAIASGRERAAYRREHMYDSYENRSMFDRCIMGFNAGPPMTSGTYNKGETLVIETAQFAGGSSSLTSTDMHLIERLTRIDPDTVAYEYTVTDPTVYIAPYTVTMPFRRTDGPLFEYACHEGNYGLHGILAGARRLERLGRELRP